MAYDEGLAKRVREILADQPGIAERRMFGGLAFLLAGNMLCGIVGQDLMVRVGPDRHWEALAAPHARPMDFTGRPMNGMVYVGPKGCATDDMLRSWIDQGLSFAGSLPAKGPAGATRVRPRRRP